ncbi:hypothetical protein DERP_001254 [Dermatophagoides pteronyssinus]|uniref:Uncharacterized protein n=1 Tax=Dermatophagoides pteronyssinus TaxID=6956 RepID=A0ABQ8JE46_DERPT|nr:hypothetical protein DERP_001254 [Dermatophagoides pteronyssinus]
MFININHYRVLMPIVVGLYLSSACIHLSYTSINGKESIRKIGNCRQFRRHQLTYQTILRHDSLQTLFLLILSAKKKQVIEVLKYQYLDRNNYHISISVYNQ